MATKEVVVLVDSSGEETTQTVDLHGGDGHDRMLNIHGAIYVRSGTDNKGRKRFTFERSQRP